MATKKRTQRIESAARQRQAGLTVILEDIHDPHNVGAISRTCEGFGIQDIHLVFDKEAQFDPTRIGKASSSSANKWLDYHIYRSINDAAGALKHRGYHIVATVVASHSLSIFQAKLSQSKLAIIIGNEHRGLSPDAIACADTAIYIPMRGMVESYNVSVATAIVLYEATRQRLSAGIDGTMKGKPLKLLLESFSGRS